MGKTSDAMIDREEIEKYARGRCKTCGEFLQQGEDEVCARHVFELERD